MITMKIMIMITTPTTIMMNNSPHDKFASIDIGTNTIRLLIACFDNGALHAIKRSLNITRLGKGFHNTGKIGEEAFWASIEVLIGYAAQITEFGVKSTRVCATGVLRKADNAGEFVNEAYKRTGLNIQIISGDKEAAMTATGVKSAIDTGSAGSIIFDVGGGSTEFIFSHGSHDAVVLSLDIGAVTLYESTVKNDPPSADELTAMNKTVRDAIKGLIKKTAGCIDSDASLIFTAGTATTLAAMSLKMGSYDPDMINNYTITYDELKTLYKELITKTMCERMHITGIEKGREDVIVSGAAIAINVMEIFKKDKMIISDSGLLEGIIIDSPGKETKI